MKLSRRDTLAIAAGAVVFAAPAVALTGRGGDARLLEMERHWLWLQQQINDPKYSDQTTDYLLDVRDRLEAAMMAEPAEGPDGLMIKARRVDYWVEGQDSGILTERYAQFVADVRRLIGGAS